MFDTRLMLVLVAVAAAALAAFFLLPQGRPQPQKDDGSMINVELTEWSLGFQKLSVPADEELTFAVRNAGTLAHGLEIEGEVNGQEKKWIIDPFQPGQTKTLTVTLSPGEYEIYCQVSGHAEAGMEGTLIAE